MENNNQVMNQGNPNSNNGNSTKLIAILLSITIVVIIVATIIIVKTMNDKQEVQETTTKKQYTVNGKYYNDDEYYYFDDSSKTYKSTAVSADNKKGSYTINKDTGEIVLDGETTLYTDGRFIYFEAMSGNAKVDYVDQNLSFVGDFDDGSEAFVGASTTYKFKSNGKVNNVLSANYMGRSGAVTTKGTYTIDKSSGLFTMDFEDDESNVYSIVKNGTMYYHVFDSNKQLK